MASGKPDDDESSRRPKPTSGERVENLGMAATVSVEEAGEEAVAHAEVG